MTDLEEVKIHCKRWKRGEGEELEVKRVQYIRACSSYLKESPSFSRCPKSGENRHYHDNVPLSTDL